MVMLALPGKFQGTESLWLDSWLSVVVGPSHDGALGVIGVSGMTSLTHNHITIVLASSISYAKACLLKYKA